MREKWGSNSKQNASSNTSNVDKDNILLNVSHSNHGNCCDVSEHLKDSPGTFLVTNMISETNVDSNNIQNEKTETVGARDEMTVVKVNETFITDNRTAGEKKQKTYAQALTENVEKTEIKTFFVWRKNCNWGTVRKLLIWHK